MFVFGCEESVMKMKKKKERQKSSREIAAGDALQFGKQPRPELSRTPKGTFLGLLKWPAPSPPLRLRCFRCRRRAMQAEKNNTRALWRQLQALLDGPCVVSRV